MFDIDQLSFGRTLMHFSMTRSLRRTVLIAATSAFFVATPMAQPVTPRAFDLFDPVFGPVGAVVYNDRRGISRTYPWLSGDDLLSVSVFATPSPDTDFSPFLGVDGKLYQSTNGATTSVSISHPAFGSQPFPLVFSGFVGLTSGLGGFRNEYFSASLRSNLTSFLPALDATPLRVTVTNPVGPTGPTSVTYNAPDYDPNARPPFVTDVALTGGGVTPTIRWNVPAGSSGLTNASVQLRTFDVDAASGNVSNIKLIHEVFLPVGVTSYRFNEPFLYASQPGFPSGLEVGKHYEASVQLDIITSSELLRGRSRTFFEFNPLPVSAGDMTVFLPSVGPDGVFKFDIAVQQGQQVLIDPLVAIGYDYQIGVGDPLFRSVKLPSIGDGVFELDLFNGTGYSFATLLNAGEKYVFAGLGVDRFRVRGIETSAGLDPTDATAFVTALTFAGDGRFTGTQTPLTLEVSAVPEPETYALMLAGLVVILSGSRRRAFGAGAPATC